MGEVKWTTKQRQAIETHGADILVSAAAGSGKTAVLVERIIQMICNPKKGVDIDRLLVLTFTKAAAAQMKEKIAQALADALSLQPHNSQLQRQMTLLQRANITTIDSFCLKVVRDHYMKVDLDPSFQTADEKTATLLQTSVLDEVMERWYEAQDEGFFQLVESFGEAMGDRRVRELVLQVYDFVQSNPFPGRWLKEAADHFAPGKDFSASYWASQTVELVKKRLEALVEKSQKTMRFCLEEGGPLGYVPALESDVAYGKDLLLAAEKGYEALAQAFLAGGFATLGRRKKDEDADVAEQCKAMRNAVKEGIQGLQKSFFFQSPQEMEENMAEMFPVAQTISRLVLDFAASYGAAKKEKLLIDYSDMEHYAISILLDVDEEGNVLGPSQTALRLQEEYVEILTDEYQDSNLVQELLLQAVSGRLGKGKNRFMVGDVKQSIYGFRQAEPSLFLEKLHRYGETGDEIRIDLSQNFRSRKPILQAVNFFFRQLMDLSLGGIVYDDRAALQYGGNFPSQREPSQGDVEVYLINRKEEEPQEEEMDAAQVEMTFVAKKILELMESGYQVYDGKGYRPLAFGDIVLLFRSAKSWSQAASQALEAAGIPVYAPNGAKYYARTEVSFMVSLLRVIDNSLQDIPLLTVLRSPVYRFTNSELLEIRLSTEEETFFERLVAYEKGHSDALSTRIGVFLSALERWKEESQTMPVSRFLWKLYDETGYFQYVGQLPPGAVRQANLRLLSQKAEAVEQTGQRGLFPFIRYIELSEAQREEEEGAVVLGEKDDLVRISTIHKSKGLEYPVVFLCGMGKRLNRQDLQQSLLLHQQGGFAFSYTDVKLRVTYPTLAKALLREKKAEENQAEELRVLYVALTRAKEKLIVTGSVPDLTAAAKKWCLTAQTKAPVLPYLDRLKAATYLDWLMPGLCRHPVGSCLWETAGMEPPLIPEEEAPFSVHLLEKEEALAPFTPYRMGKEKPGKALEEQVLERLEGTYGAALSTGLPANVSISEIKRHHSDLPEGTLPFYLQPSSYSFRETKENGAVARQKGTAMHTMMEHLDFSQSYTKESLQFFAQQLVQKRLLEAEEVALLDWGRLLHALGTPLMQRMKAVGNWKKEESFTMALSPYEVFGTDEMCHLDEQILLHGIIDCYFEEEDGLVLVDYKTNDTADPTGLTLAKQYQLQLSIYAKALGRLTNKPVKQIYLYSFHLQQAIDCTTLCLPEEAEEGR